MILGIGTDLCNIDRIAALGGGIAVQHRMAFQGEYFVERYGAAAAEATPPIRRMMEGSFGKIPTTSARRFTSLFRRSIGLVL